MVSVCRKRAIAISTLWLLYQCKINVWFHFLEHKEADKKV